MSARRMTVTSEFLPLLRDALYREVGMAGEALHDRLNSPDAPHIDWSEPVAQFDRARAVLDVIGWNDREPEPDAVLDIQPYRCTITRALRGSLATEYHLMGEQGDDAKRQRDGARTRARTIEAWAESVGLDLDAEPVEHLVAVPADFMDLLVESLLADFTLAAQGVEGAGVTPASYPTPLAWFDAIRALLDELGWGERETVDIDDVHREALQRVRVVDLDVHREALQRVLVDRLEEEHARIVDADRNITAEGAQKQRESAYRWSLQVEQFMDAAGLDIPEAGDRDA
jgi:hypothetical protein